MLNTSGDRMKKCGSILTLWLCGLASAFANPYDVALLKSFSSASVFYQSSKYYTNVMLVAGDMQYRRTDDGREGYQPLQALQFEAQGSLRIFDHKANKSALELYRGVERQLERLKFQTLYRCDFTECGDVSGWQLYLNEMLMGDEESQHYVLAKTDGVNGEAYYAQFYVIELDGQPRSFLRVVGPVNLDVSSVDKTANDDWVSLFFIFNSVQLIDKSQRELVALADKIELNKVSKIIITGHADNQGGKTYNQAIAMRRADYIATRLTSEFGLKSLQIEKRSSGENAPYSDNRSAEGRERNRRVTVQLVSAD
jgi:outer membrane protein OmpA-like peptidoglycan-associated protein